MGNVSNFNSTLISIIGALPIEAKIKWQEQLSTLIHAYNCSCANATGFSPFYLMYRRQPKKESEHSKRRYDWNVKCTK